MSGTYVIETIEALRALSDPLRMRILESLRRQSLTASQIARHLDEKANKLHYHLNELERNGLLKVVETRQKGNLIEKYYGPVASNYRVDRALFERGDGSEALDAYYQSITSIVDITTADLRAAIDTGQFTEKDASSSLQTLRRGFVSREKADEFRRRLGDLIGEYEPPRGDDENPDDRQNADFYLTIVCYSLSNPGSEKAIATNEPVDDTATNAKI